MEPQAHPFDQYVKLPVERIRLAQAALYFALDEYPQLRTEIYLSWLDQIADRAHLARAESPREQIATLQREIVRMERLKGSRDDYRNPENSYLNRVIERRRGIPITVGAIWLDVASILGWPIVGIGTPGHFLVRHQQMDKDIFIDPSLGGVEVSREVIRHMLARLIPFSDALADSAFAPVDNRYILRRMLGNLYTCYLERNDLMRAVRVLRRMVAVVPGEVPLQAELARVLALVGHFDEAVGVAQRAWQWTLDEEEKRIAYEALRHVQMRLAELN